jgi:16S rRNA (adenine1518-N6/adenine1519-N6)-dimethyltransferase
MRAKKSLGQNFLRSKSALRAIVDAADLSVKDFVLEVGPGKGALTELLLEKTGKVLAIEMDTELIPILQEKFPDLELVQGDILDLNEEGLPPYKLVANIPYYITGEILEKFLSSSNQPSQMVLLMQKEVVDRIMERDGKGSILSKSIQVYGEPKYITKVPARAFSPAPKVDSAVLSVQNISKKAFDEISEEQFFKVLKTGFAHKRKKLIKNLEKLTEKENLVTIFQKLSINPDTRPEKLSTEEWISLAKEIF